MDEELLIHCYICGKDFGLGSKQNLLFLHTRNPKTQKIKLYGKIYKLQLIQPKYLKYLNISNAEYVLDSQFAANHVQTNTIFVSIVLMSYFQDKQSGEKYDVPNKTAIKKQAIISSFTLFFAKDTIDNLSFHRNELLKNYLQEQMIMKCPKCKKYSSQDCVREKNIQQHVKQKLLRCCATPVQLFFKEGPFNYNYDGGCYNSYRNFLNR